MTYQSVEAFLDYYKRIRKRTLRVIQCIPPDRMEHAPIKDGMTFGDIIRHIANTERYSWAETVQGSKPAYEGYGKEFSEKFSSVIEYMEALHQESLKIFSKLSPEAFNGKCLTPAGHPITVWKWLRAMVEHEIHHRGIIYAKLRMMNIKTPPIFGLTAEELATRK
ncbi:MAG: DinB family protein [Candidatus Odinarchaeota archaeon]